jgi:hypothetical protein
MNSARHSGESYTGKIIFTDNNVAKVSKISIGGYMKLN